MDKQEPRYVYRKGFGIVPAHEETKDAPTTSEIEAMATVKSFQTLSEARDTLAVDLYQKTLDDIEKAPEEEREALKEKAWIAFARANQKAHEEEMEMLKKLLNG